MRNTLITGVVFAIIFIAMIFLVSPANAVINITTTNSTDGITWSWNPDIKIERMSINGIMNPNWDNQSSQYRLNNNAIEKNSGYYTIKIYSASDSGENTSYIPPTETVVDDTLRVLGGYAFFIVAVVLILIGAYVPFIAFAGAVFAVMGIIDMQGVSFWGGFLFMLIFCAAVFVGFAKLKED